VSELLLCEAHLDLLSLSDFRELRCRRNFLFLFDHFNSSTVILINLIGLRLIIFIFVLLD